MDYDEMSEILDGMDDGFINSVMSGEQVLSNKQRYAIRAYLISMADIVGKKLYHTKRLSDCELAKKYNEDECCEIIMSTLHIQSWFFKYTPLVLFSSFLFLVIVLIYIG